MRRSDAAATAAASAVGQSSAKRPPLTLTWVSSRPVEMALLFVAPLLWIAPAWTSLWLDEGITYWVIKDGLGEAIRRAREYQGQSPLYFLIEWLAITLGGHSEFVLRLPSLVAIGLATWTILGLGRWLFDDETGLVAATLFAYWVYLMSNMSYNARPYALAIFAVAASTLALIRWFGSNRMRDAAIYVGFAALLLYSQPLYAGLFGVHLVALLEYRRRGKTSVSILHFYAALGGAVALTLPLAPQMISFWRLHRAVYLSSPPIAGVASLLLWPAAIIAATVLVQRRLVSQPPVFLYLWCLAPPLWLLCVTLLSGDVGPIGRYNYWQFPAIVLATAAALRAIRRPLRLAVLVALALLAFSQADRPALEDWRRATALARPFVNAADTPVLIRSGLPQARLRKWLEDPEAAQVVLAPLAFYPMPGAPKALPYELDDEYLRGVILPAVGIHARIIIVSHDFDFERMRRLPLKAWFDSNLPAHRSTQVARLGNIVIVVYDRV